MEKFRKTKPVIMILKEFEHHDGAISLADLIKRFQEKMNRTTVYRVLQRLEDSRLLHSFMGMDGLKWYAKCEGPSTEQHVDAHPHFQCKKCGKVECLPLDIAMPSVPDYKIDSVELLLVGQCKDCLS